MTDHEIEPIVEEICAKILDAVGDFDEDNVWKMEGIERAIFLLIMQLPKNVRHGVPEVLCKSLHENIEASEAN